MKLADLLAALPHEALRSVRGAQSDIEIVGITCDSRQVQPGMLFVAVPGVDVDGHTFIPAAVKQGAVAVVGQRAPAGVFLERALVPYVTVADTRAALALLSAAWYGYPGRQMRVIGVTGTEGKTTTVRLVHAILLAAGYRVGLISTVNALIGDEEIDTGLHTTTPDALALQHYLAQMAERDSQYAVIEVTSHGLDQHRVTGCEFDVAVITNITHDHLDYHHTFQEYRAAKARLFENLRTSYRKNDVAKVSILNADDSSYDFLEAYAAERCYSYGIECPSDVQATDMHLSSTGTSFTAVTPCGDFEVVTPLVGKFSVYNTLAAIATGVSQGVSFEAMQHGISAMRGVEGRMERIEMGQDFTVMIDFAHTPNALDKALQTARSLTAGKMTVVFGCAGLRDRSKRSLMGEIAAKLSDYVVLTAEDPRTEDVNDIMEQIAEGCRHVGKREGVDFWRIADRGEAIAAAIQKARAGDLVVVTGKGHERSMCYGTTEYPWSEHEVVRKALLRRLGGLSRP